MKIVTAAAATVGIAAATLATAGFASASTTPPISHVTESFNSAGTSMTVAWQGGSATPLTGTIMAQTQGAFPANQGTNNISVPAGLLQSADTFTVAVNPDQTYLSTPGGVYSAWATSPGSPLAGTQLSNLTLTGTPNPTYQNFTVSANTPSSANTLEGLEFSVDGGAWSGAWPLTASAVNGVDDHVVSTVNGVNTWSMPVNAISGVNIVGNGPNTIGVRPASGTVWATGSTHTVAVRANDNGYGADGNTVTKSWTVALPAGTTPMIGIGTGTGTSAPYFGAGAYSTTDPAAPGIGVYPAIPVAPGASITTNMLVQNTGTATEVATIAGSGGEALNPANTKLQLSAYSDGATAANAVYVGAASTVPHAMPASWVKTPATQTLTWDQEITTPVTITVPAGTPAGTYYGVVYATVTGAPASVAGGGFGITSQVQSGVRAYITVS